MRTALVLLLTCAGSSPLPAQSESAFGAQERNGATLIGIFYDLKQTQQRQPVERKSRHYEHTVEDFILAGFYEALRNRFFSRCPSALHHLNRDPHHERQRRTQGLWR